jgi:L-lysine 6-transaminase
MTMTPTDPRTQRAFSVLRAHMTMDRFDLVLDLDRSEGHWLRSLDGRELLDTYSAFASLPLGWNHPRLLEEDFVAKLGRAAVHKPALSDTFTEEVADFVTTFYRVAAPPEMPWAFFIEGGGLAVENCLKAAFDWKVRKNLAAGLGEKGSKIIHFRNCFHGRTGYTMSLTDSADPRKTQYFPKFDWPRITAPALRFPLTDAAMAEVEAAEAQALREIDAAFAKDPHEIAAILIEPIQCEGGDNHFRDQFLQELRRICDEREALLIFDEVQTGVGATGSFWYWQQAGPRPDLMSFGKKTQVCGLIASRRMDEVERNVFVEPSRINSTFGGNLVDMLRFQRVLEVMEEEKLVENARRVGEVFRKELEDLAPRHPALLGNPRGKGLILAVDLPDAETRNAVLNASMEEGLFALSCGLRSVRFRPALTFSEELAVEAVRRFGRAVERVARGA